MQTEHNQQTREAVRLAMIGIGLIAAGLLTPHKGAQNGESLWTLAHDSSWQKLGDWPAAEASLAIVLFSCGALFLLLAGRRLWRIWLLPRFLNQIFSIVQALPFITLIVGLYYLVRALF